MEDCHVDEGPPSLETTGHSIQQTEYTHHHWDYIQWVIPVVQNDSSVVEVPVKVWERSKVFVDQMRHGTCGFDEVEWRQGTVILCTDSQSVGAVMFFNK